MRPELISQPITGICSFGRYPICLDLDELKADTGKTYLLVAHNGIARVVQSYFYDMTNEEYAAAGIRNCELVEYHFE